ncbi:uncharacterized protein LOC135385140 [Ornithodoros turicata]|uniref:uncharacterized protein LOC135385140 n=1 Tax=Ornithodoros turicata TaxID=34597 RepID=UPI003138B610
MVAESRSKFGTKGKPSQRIDTAVMRRNETPRLPDNPLNPSGTGTAQEDLSWLLNEYKKQRPDMQQMRERLRATFQVRSQKMKSSTVAASLKEFPYLIDFRFFMQEFQLLTQKDASKGVEAANEDVLNMVTRKQVRCSQEAKDGVAAWRTINNCERRKNHLRCIQALRVLSEIFKEKKAVDTLFLHEPRADASVNILILTMVRCVNTLRNIRMWNTCGYILWVLVTVSREDVTTKGRE